MSDAPKVIWAVMEARRHWSVEKPTSEVMAHHAAKYHHDSTVTALEERVERLEKALRVVSEWADEEVRYAGKRLDIAYDVIKRVVGGREFREWYSSINQEVGRGYLLKLHTLRNAARNAPKETGHAAKVNYVCPDDDTMLDYIEASYGSDLRCAVSCMIDALLAIDNGTPTPPKKIEIEDVTNYENLTPEQTGLSDEELMRRRGYDVIDVVGGYKVFQRKRTPPQEEGAEDGGL